MSNYFEPGYHSPVKTEKYGEKRKLPGRLQSCSSEN